MLYAYPFTIIGYIDVENSAVYVLRTKYTSGIFK